MQPLISVIVPIYDVEAYLDGCVASIMGQSYPHLEIILVDDGSPDLCGAMCDRWAEKDPRIRVVHKENGGLSDARNAGLTVATGEYVGFVDSDDSIDRDFYKILLERIEATGSDIACCEPEKDGQYDTRQALDALIGGNLRQVVWNKLYKRSVAADILFPKGKCHEDEFWSYPVFARAKRVVSVDFPGYHYRQRPDSIMGKAYSLQNLDGLEAKQQRQLLLEAKFPTLAQKGRIDLVFFCMYHGQKALRCLSEEDRRKAFIFIKAILASHWQPLRSQKQLSVAHRIWYRLMPIHPVLTCHLRNWLHIGL